MRLPLSHLSPALMLCASALLQGCVNLAEVRDFSKQSSAITASTQAFDYEMAAAQRNTEYQQISRAYPVRVAQGQRKVGDIDFPDVPRPLLLNAAQQQSIRSVHRVLAKYMLQVSALADDSAIDTDRHVDALVKDLNDFPSAADPTERAKRNDAYGALLKLIKLPLDGWRHYELKTIIHEADPDITLLTELLALQTENMAHRIATEGREVDAWYARRLAEYPSQSFSATLESNELRKTNLAASKQKYVAAMASAAAIAQFGEIHHQMDLQLGMLNSDSVKRLMANIRTARLEVEEARQQYHDAFSSD
jgi:hypothetical protein